MVKRTIIVGVAAIGVAACGGSPSQGTRPPSPAPTSTSQITVDKTGIGGNPQAIAWSFGAVVTNHSARETAEQILVTATAYDKQGTPVASSNSSVNLIQQLAPGKSTFFAAQLPESKGTTPARVDVHTRVGRWEQMPHYQTGEVQIQGLNVSPSSATIYGPEYSVKATATSTYSSDRQAQATVLCFDPAGNIIGAVSNAVPILPSQQPTVIDVHGIDTPSAPASCQMAVVPSLPTQ